MSDRHNTDSIYIREIPADLKAAYKAHCAHRSKTMRETIIKHMRETIKPKK